MKSEYTNPVKTSLLLCLLAGVAVKANAAQVYVDPPQNWQGYMNWFVNDNGTMGAYVAGGTWGAADLRATISGTTLTLAPNINVYNPTDAYWVNPDGSGAKWMDALYYVQNDGLLGQSVTFSGDALQNSLVSPYTCTAFIKEFDSNYQIINQTSVSLAGGQPFNLDLTTGTGAHVQYGFELMGPDANPATADALGFASVQIVPEPTTAALLILGLGLPFYFFRRQQ